MLRSVSGANDAGAITGSYAFVNAFGRLLFIGFLRDPDGKFTSFGFGVGDDTSPSSINNKGAITGWFSEFPFGAGPISGFVGSPGGTITIFDPPFCGDSLSLFTIATSINDEEVITGYCIPIPGSTRVGWVRFP